jgi:protein-S-isoprenylcysteine O-methyltransferase Ste14
MDTTTSDNKSPNQTPALVVKLPGIMLVGRAAVTLLLVFLALIIALIIYLRPTFSSSPLWISLALWILFITYWSAKAKNSAPEKSSESEASRQLHQLLMNAALLLLFIPVPGLRLRYLPNSPFVVSAGLAIHMASILLALWARRHLGRNWSGAITVKVDHELVRTGPYKLVRHPIYSAMLGMFVGTALVSGQLHALAGLGLIAFAYWRKIRLEEERLRAIFGADYDAYRGKTWGLIPGLF